MTERTPAESKKEIPLDARVSFVDHAASIASWKNVKKIAEEIGTNDQWVYRAVKEFGIRPEVHRIDGLDVSVYPPWTSGVLSEELRWRDNFRELPSELSVSDMAEILGRSRRWTQYTLEEIGATPVPDLPLPRYGKAILQDLRHICMAVPLDQGWYNLTELVELVGADYRWITSRLIREGVESTLRRSSRTGRVYDYYPPHALRLLLIEKQKRPKPAGDWLTERGIATAIGRSKKWVSARIESFREYAEPLQDDNGVTRIHYPPEVLNALKDESERSTVRRLSNAAQRLSVTQIESENDT